MTTDPYLYRHRIGDEGLDFLLLPIEGLELPDVGETTIVWWDDD